MGNIEKKVDELLHLLTDTKSVNEVRSAIVVVNFGGRTQRLIMGNADDIVEMATSINDTVTQKVIGKSDNVAVDVARKLADLLSGLSDVDKSEEQLLRKLIRVKGVAQTKAFLKEKGEDCDACQKKDTCVIWRVIQEVEAEAQSKTGGENNG